MSPTGYATSHLCSFILSTVSKNIAAVPVLHAMHKSAKIAPNAPYMLTKIPIKDNIKIGINPYPKMLTVK